MFLKVIRNQYENLRICRRHKTTFVEGLTHCFSSWFWLCCWTVSRSHSSQPSAGRIFQQEQSIKMTEMLMRQSGWNRNGVYDLVITKQQDAVSLESIFAIKTTCWWRYESPGTKMIDTIPITRSRKRTIVNQAVHIDLSVNEPRYTYHSLIYICAVSPENPIYCRYFNCLSQ